MLCHFSLRQWFVQIASGCMLAGLLFGAAGSARALDVYYTSFEQSEGYDRELDLVGQVGWEGTDAGPYWNGLVTNLITGFGQQQAYIGFYPPLFTQVNLWRPLNFHPLASNAPVVVFSVVMRIVDTDTPPFDDFQWTVYNTQTNRLFTLDFDNDNLGIYYALDGTNNNYVYTGASYQPGVAYGLVVTMNFASNLWSATLGGTSIVTDKPITTSGALLTIGDIDAEWVIRNSAQPGDNFMVFDDYRVSAQVTVPNRPHLQVTGRLPDGSTLLRLTGQNNYAFAIEGTTNLVNWIALKTNVITGGFFDYVDNGAAGLPRRYYRARWVP